MLLAIIASLFVAIQDPIIQKFAARFAGGYLSEKTGADIKVGGLIVTPDFRVVLDDVVVKDLNDNNLAKVDKLRTKINIGDLLEGQIHLEDLELRNTEANIIKYEGEDRFNFAFLVDAFRSDTIKKETKPIDIVVDKISLKNIDFVYWNQNKDHPDKTERHLMDYAHIGLDSISLEAKDFSLRGDSIQARIDMLRARERSGLEMKSFESDVLVCSKGIFLDGMKMETNNSRFDTDLHMLYNDYSAFSHFVDSVTFDAVIRPTDMLLSDVGVFADVMNKMPDRLLFEGHMTGPIEHFRVDSMKAAFGNATRLQGSISMHPLDFMNGYHTLKIDDMHFTYDDLVNFYIPASTKTIPLPESLRPLNEGRVSLDFKGSYNDFVSDIIFNSGMGDIDASIARALNHKGDNQFSGFVNATGVKAGAIANVSKYVGDLDMNADFMVTFPKNGGPEFKVDGMLANAELLGNHIDEVKLDGDLKENRFKGKVTVDDDDLYLDFNGMIDFQNKKYPKSDFTAVIRNANLKALHLNKEDSISVISTKVYMKMKGFNLDDLEGEVRLDSTVYRDGRGSYFMDDFAASIVNDQRMKQRITVDCDFLNFEMAGIFNFASLMMTFNEYADSYVHFPIWEGNREAFQKYSLKHNVEQDFIVRLNLKDTQTISRLLMPSVSIAKNTYLTGSFTSRNNTLYLTLRSSNVRIGNVELNNLEVINNNDNPGVTVTTLKLDEIRYKNIKASDTLELSLDKFFIVSRMKNDTVFASIRWDDLSTEDHNRALIRTYFHPHELGGIFSITSANITVNDSLWNALPGNYVDITDGRMNISNLMFTHNEQSIRANGYVPMNEGDTISVQLHRFDISNLDMFFKGFDVDGFVSGDAMLSSMKTDPMVLADIKVEQLGVNGETIGDAIVESLWNNANKSVDVDMNIIDHKKEILNVSGSYYTQREDDNLDFAVEFDSLRLVAFSPFLSGIVSRMQGFGEGVVDISGSVQQPDINGRIKLVDAGCHINYLNTFYTLSPTILIDNQSISFEDLVLTDTLNHQARVEGHIRHNRFKDFYLDLKMHPRDFLAMATTSRDNESFYGTAVADGLITVEGPFNDIHLNIKARTKKGTQITLPLNTTSMVKDNDFIVFVSNELEEGEAESQKKEEKVKNSFSLHLEVNATDDASLKIFLPGNIGTIDASGNGTVKLGTSTNEAMTMFGEYTIKTGHFQLTLLNFVSKMFTLQQGGTISWSGSPTDGRINATGVFSTKGSLSDLGVQIDSTSSVNDNVNVECLIHLKDALLNPTISFGMRLPNATEDIIQTVYTLIDTTNQSVMANQALSLLVLGKFAYAGSSATADQTLDLSNFFSTQMQVDITNHLNLGLSYHSGSLDSYDEYQLALRTQLFEERLTIETNVGVMTSNSGDAASNIVGEFDLYYKLSRDGRLQGHFYNHSNYNSNFNSFAIDRRAPYTQGLGLSYSRSFDTFRNLFRKKTVNPNQPLIVRPRQPENN